MDCPGGAQFCAAPACVCNTGFTGVECDVKDDAGITASAFLRSSAAQAQFRSARNASDVNEPEAEACLDAPVCRNGGTLDKTSCECKCPPSFTGRECGKCTAKPCPDNLSRSPETCQCVCALASPLQGVSTCLHGGSFDAAACRCGCKAPWTGPRCDVCLPQDCAHGGVWDPELCRCRCPAPWASEDNCATCPVKQCANGADFDPSTCSCRCKGRWRGELCEECPAPQELALMGITCGHRGFDRSKCDCRHDCPPIDCLHGGKQDPDTCGCTCNVANVPKTTAAPAAPSPAKTVVAASDGIVVTGGNASAEDEEAVEPVIVPSIDEAVQAAQVPADEASSLLQSAADWAAGTDASLLQASARQARRRFLAEPGAADEGEAAPSDEVVEDEAQADADDEGDAAASKEEDDEEEEEEEGTRGGEAESDPAAPEAEGSTRSGWVPAVPLAAAQVAVSPLGLSSFSRDTFWEGERCEVCQPPPDLVSAGGAARGVHVAPQSCPRAHTFNMSTCACQPACPVAMCANGGSPVLLERNEDTGPVRASAPAIQPHQGDADDVIARGDFTCGCRCRPPWSGPRCSVRASGATPVSAGRSCLAILRARPGAGSGRYWINPSGVAPLENAFEVFCDMNEDGGGWTEVARVGGTLSSRLIDANSYEQGAAVGGGQEFILPCGRLDGLDGSRGPLRRFVVRVSVGSVRDYFRGAPEHAETSSGGIGVATLCEMLRSHDRHLWSPFFRQSMLDGSEALVVTGSDGRSSVVLDAADAAAGSDVVVVAAANASAEAAARTSSSPAASGEEESPVMVRSLDAAQFRQFMGHRQPAATPRRPDVETPRAEADEGPTTAGADLAPGVSRSSALLSPPDSADSILSKVLSARGAPARQDQRFREGAGAAGSVLDPGSAADRMLEALVGRPAHAADLAGASPVASAASAMRFARAGASAGASAGATAGASAGAGARGGTDWKKYSWMLPPQGFAGPYGNPAVFNSFGGPSLPGPPTPMASMHSVVNSFSGQPQPIPGVGPMGATSERGPAVFEGDAVDAGSPVQPSPSQGDESGPDVVVTVSTGRSAHAMAQHVPARGEEVGVSMVGERGLVHPADSIAGSSAPRGPDPRGGVPQRPIITTMGELAAASSRGSGPPDSTFGKMLPPGKPLIQGFSTSSIDPNFFRFRSARHGHATRHGNAHAGAHGHHHRTSARASHASSPDRDPMEAAFATGTGPRFRERTMGEEEAVRRRLAEGGLRPVLGSGITADDVPSWHARVAGRAAAVALLQEQAVQGVADRWRMARHHARAAVAAAPSFLQARALHREADGDAASSAAPGDEASAEGEAPEGEGEGEGDAEATEAGASDPGAGGEAEAEGRAKAAPVEAGVPHNPSGWVRPAYVDAVMNPQFEGLLGGSRKDWPTEIDGRMYISFWGGNRGGCCHETSRNYGGKVDEGGWAREFRVHVMEVDPALFAKGNDFDFRQLRASGQPRFKDESDPLERV